MKVFGLRVNLMVNILFRKRVSVKLINILE